MIVRYCDKDIQMQELMRYIIESTSRSVLPEERRCKNVKYGCQHLTVPSENIDNVPYRVVSSMFF
jgi:hypothetical protein